MKNKKVPSPKITKENVKKNPKIKKADKVYKPKKKKNIKKIILMILLSGFILGMISLSILAIYIVKIAPKFDPDRLFRAEATVIYDKDGNEKVRLGREKREKITYSQLPEVLIDAIVATEDSRFFEHNGFDFPRFLKATLKQASGDSGAGGASTLTMQVVYNNFTERKKNPIENILRKFTDIYMSIFHVEQEYSKEEIMEFYVNIPFLGNNAYGVEQASLSYFGKSVSELTLPEASLIAGLFQAPSTYNPYLYPEKAEKRRATVLYLMKRHGYITDEEERLANSISVESLLHAKVDDVPYQGFIDTVVEEVIKKTGGDNPYDVPMKIYTTLDSPKQEAVEKILSGETFTFENDVVQTAFTVTDTKTGAIAAVGAGRNREGERSYNLATMMKRQPGSTAKPIFDYAPAIEFNNWAPATLILDEPVGYTNGPEINNWDGKFNGLMTLRNALSLSRNTPALRAFQQTNNKSITTMVKNLGLSPEMEGSWLHEAHALGSFDGTSPLEMGAAYAAFGNGGYYIEPYSVTRIEYRNTDKVLIHEEVKRQAMSEETAYMITSSLITSVNEGISTGARLRGVQMAAKTGTTNFTEETLKANGLPYTAINDLWIIGYSPDYVVSLWYGYSKINKDFYNTIPSGVKRDKLYQAIIKEVIPVTGSSFTKPEGIIEVAIEKETSPIMLPSPNTPADMIATEIFKKGTEPTEISPRYAILNDVTDIKATQKDDYIKLSWSYTDPIQLDKQLLTNYFNTAYGTFGQKYLDIRLNYNTNILGNNSFYVYIKENDKLTLLGKTNEHTFSYKVKDDKKITFVIKNEYNNIKTMNSDGAEVSITPEKTIDNDVVDISLVGKSEITLKVGDDYKEANPAVNVIDNGLPVLTGFTVEKEIKDAKNTVVKSLDNSKANTYTITYKVDYKGTTKTLTKKIIFK